MPNQRKPNLKTLRRWLHAAAARQGLIENGDKTL